MPRRAPSPTSRSQTTTLSAGIYGYFNVVEQCEPDYLSNNVQWNNKNDPTPVPNLGADPAFGPSSPTAPWPLPTIASFSNDTGKAGDGITSDNTLQLKGTAAANSAIKVYDNGTQIGTATANSIRQLGLCHQCLD